jgi:N-carbamoyl-L-amino-acid hydrolase
MDLIRQAGADPKIDAAGNILARRLGTEPGLKPIMIGSHTDSVPGGGNFDGALGSMAAIEVLRTLTERNVAVRHPLTVVLWSNEEGGTVGSGLAVGSLDSKALDLALNGIQRSAGIRRIGGDPDHLADSRIAPGSTQAYVELHIEQSGLLERAGLQIGVVDGIVAIDEYEVEITGVANHAGTTPMAERRNALLAAAKLVEMVQDEITREPGRQVGNVGHLEVFPNARNVVPGRVKLTIELRDLDAAKIRVIGDRILKRAQEISADTRATVDVQRVDHSAPSAATPAIQKEVETSAAALGLKFMHLPSGASHDAGNMAVVAPMGMIFVPSVAGVSHSPNELTSWTDCANGANVLLQTVLRLDKA